ncbi:MAG: polyphosphate polymerase domain-containing protein [Candidatus Krumholzibacteria bacterium]|nr:polyphosphate polymerase domain-containing protein [Candidatus Krumholzibacteria bacterium]
MDLQITNGDVRRYERKFFISSLSAREVEAIVRLHPAIFSEIYHERPVNNIYFDTHNLGSFVSNVEGSAQRLKVRIRWYGDTFGFVASPVLEFKIKSGFVGHKKSFALASFGLDQLFTCETARDCFNRSDLPDGVEFRVNSLDPTLLNSYRRRYFRSADRRYRITLDTDASFYRIGRKNNSFTSKLSDRINVILEVKYDEECDADADRITNHFPFRMTKSSKYVSGIDNLYIW